MLLMIYKDSKGNKKWIKAENKESLKRFILKEDIDKNEVEIFNIKQTRGEIE